MNIKKCSRIILMIILVLMFIPKNVYAVSIQKDTSTKSSNSTYAKNHPARLYYNGVDADITVKYNGKKVKISSGGGVDGNFAGCHPFTSRKVFTNDTSKEAYCIRNEQWFGSGGGFSTALCNEARIASNPYTKVKGVTSSNVVYVAGEVVDVINSKSWNKNKKYLYKVASLTVLFQLSYCTYDADGQIKDIIQEAYNNYVSKAVTNKNNYEKNVAMTTTNSVMGKKGTSTTYISDAVNVTGLMTSLNGTAATYTFSGTGSGTIYLCTKADGTGCTAVNGTTITNATSKTYYVRVDNGVPNSNIKISLDSSVKYNLKYGKFYCHDGTQEHRDWQPLFVPTTVSTSTKVHREMTLNIPKDIPVGQYEHDIQIKKVNSDGEPIEGAKFKLTE